MCSVTCTQQAAHPSRCSLYCFPSVWESQLVQMCTLLLTTTSAPCCATPGVRAVWLDTTSLSLHKWPHRCGQGAAFPWGRHRPG